ncbi:MAG: phosphoglycerate mutase family protein [Acidobacteriota bacterium]
MNKRSFLYLLKTRYLLIGLSKTIILVSAFSVALACQENVRTARDFPVTTVLLVRHAEKSGPSGDVPLSEAGLARARELVRIIGRTGVKAIYATQFQRTQQTAQPLADHLRLTINKIAANNTKGLVEAVLSKHVGEIVLIVGHSDTVPDIIAKLGGGEVAPIAENEFDRLYLITIYQSGQAKVVELRY